MGVCRGLLIMRNERDSNISRAARSPRPKPHRPALIVLGKATVPQCEEWVESVGGWQQSRGCTGLWQRRCQGHACCTCQHHAMLTSEKSFLWGYSQSKFFCFYGVDPARIAGVRLAAPKFQPQHP